MLVEAGRQTTLREVALPIAEHRDAMARRVAELETERLQALKIGYQQTQDCQSLPEMAQALVDAIEHLSKQVDREFAAAVAVRTDRDTLADAIAEALAITAGMHDQPRATISLALATARTVLHGALAAVRQEKEGSSANEKVD